MILLRFNFYIQFDLNILHQMDDSKNFLHYAEENKARALTEDLVSGNRYSMEQKPAYTYTNYQGIQPKVKAPTTFEYSTSSNIRKSTSKRDIPEDNISRCTFGQDDFMVSNQNLKNSTAIRVQEECCVTVFGYTPAHKLEFLRELGKCGRIVEYQEKGKNWINVRYSKGSEAIKALELHGNLINNLGLIIGVKKCEDREFFQKSLDTKGYNNTKQLPKNIYGKIEKRSWFLNFLEYIFNW